MIKLTQKETELKIDGRMFGQSPAYERLRRVIQEKHVSKAFKYNTHQSYWIEFPSFMNSRMFSNFTKIIFHFNSA